MIVKRPAWAKASAGFEGRRYAIACDWHGEGEVLSRDDNRVVLRFRNESTPGSVLYGWTGLPAFIVSDGTGSEVARFHRTRRMPRPVFEFLAAGRCVGKVVQTNLIYTNYELELLNGEKWRLRLPLFTIGFFGSSSKGGKMLFWLESHRVWNLLIEHGHDSELLLAAMAFLHRERLRHQ